mgnify:CR=1 FL=1
MKSFYTKYNRKTNSWFLGFFVLAFIISPEISFAQREFDIYFNINDFEMTLANGEVSINTTLPFAAYSEDTRKPAFPLFPYKILIPQDSVAIQYNVTFDSNMVYSKVDVKKNQPVATTNGEIIGEVHDTIVSVMNPVLGSQTIGFGDYRYTCLTVSPFLYDASLGNLFFVSHIKIIVPSFPATAGTSAVEDWPLKFRDVAETLANNQDLDIFYYNTSWGGGSGAPLDYLIITNPDLAASFQELAEWKRRKGYWTEIVTIDSISSNYPGTDVPQKIKNFLYSNLDRNIKFVLIGGDNTVVPCRYCAFPTYSGYTPADIYYSCFSDFNSGDWDKNSNGIYGEKNDSIDFSPEFYLSRLPVRTASQATGYISKLIQYEMSADTTSTNRILLTGYSSDGYHDTAKNYNNYLFQNHIQPYWNGHRYYMYENESFLPDNDSYSISVSNLINEINKGYNIIHEVSHGGVGNWVLSNGSSYTWNHAYSQTNTLSSVIVTNACSTNAFDEETCLSEAFIRNPDGGAIAYFGSSREGFSTGLQFNESFMYDAFFFENLYRGLPYDAPYCFGSVATKAKRAMTDYFYDDTNRFLQLSINPIGDPEMPIFTGKPDSFVKTNHSGTIEPVILINTRHKYVTIRSTVSGCRIVLMEDDGNIQVRDNVQEASFYTHYGTHKATILKHNYTPYLTTVALINIPNPPGPVTMNIRKSGSSYEISAMKTITEDGCYYGTAASCEGLNDWTLRIVNIITGEIKVNTVVPTSTYICDTSSWEDGTYAILARDEENAAQQKILISNH